MALAHAPCVCQEGREQGSVAPFLGAAGKGYLGEEGIRQILELRAGAVMRPDLATSAGQISLPRSPVRSQERTVIYM